MRSSSSTSSSSSCTSSSCTSSSSSSSKQWISSCPSYPTLSSYSYSQVLPLRPSGRINSDGIFGGKKGLNFLTFDTELPANIRLDRITNINEHWREVANCKGDSGKISRFKNHHYLWPFLERNISKLAAQFNDSLLLVLLTNGIRGFKQEVVIQKMNDWTYRAVSDRISPSKHKQRGVID